MKLLILSSMRKKLFKLKVLLVLGGLLISSVSFGQTCDITGNGGVEFGTVFSTAVSGNTLCIDGLVVVSATTDFTAILDLTIVIQNGGELRLDGFGTELQLGAGSILIINSGGQVTEGGLFTSISIDGVTAYFPLFGFNDPTPVDGPATITPGGTTELSQLFSITTGNWNTNGTWSTTSGGVSCGCIPTATDFVTVENPHIVSINTANAENNGLTILSGGTVQWTSANNLTIRNSGNIDIQPGGSLDENGQANVGLVIDNTNASFLINAGTLNLDNITINDRTVSFYIDNSNSFTITNDLPASNGTTITNTSFMIFLNLDGGDFDFTFDNSATITQQGEFQNMGGIETISNLNGGFWSSAGRNFDSGTELYCNNGVNTFNYNRVGPQLVIVPQDNYINLTTSGSGRKRIQGDTDVNGDLSIDGSSSLDVQSVGGGTQYNIFLAGDWIINSSNSDPFVERGRRVTFDGGSAQEIRGTTLIPLTLRRVTFNTTGLTLSLPLELERGATFTNGIVQSDVINLFTFLDGSSTSSGNSSSFINGPVIKLGTTDFVFPIGAGTKWARLGISSLSGNETFTAEYNEAVYSDVTVAGLSHVSGYEHWVLTRSGAQTAAITLYWEDGSPTGSDITDIGPTDLVVASYNGADWVSEGQVAPIPGTTAAGNVTSVANVATNYSVFTFGSLTGINPLPIELASFTGRQENTIVNLIWETASELNNDFFTLRRSYDGEEFDVIATIEGAGNSNKALNYSHQDIPSKSGVIYYQLTQTDFDGTSETFDIIGVRYESNSDLIQVYPNPLSGNELTVLFPGEPQGKVVINIYSLTGEIIYQKEFINPGNTLTLNIDDSRSKGIYFLKIATETEGFTSKLYLE